MVLVPVGRRLVDITVDGVELVAGEEISYDKSYNLTTSYPARIKVDGSTKYTNTAHNQDTTYNVNTSASVSGDTINSNRTRTFYNSYGNGTRTGIEVVWTSEGNPVDLTVDYNVYASSTDTNEYGDYDLYVDGTRVDGHDRNNMSGTWSGTAERVWVRYEQGSGTRFNMDVDVTVDLHATASVSSSVSEQ